MFKPKSIKIIFRTELLPRLGRFSEPDIRPFIEEYIADHAWLWGPTIYADITPDGFVDLTFKGFYWPRSKRSNAAHSGGNGPGYYECEPGETWIPRVPIAAGAEVVETLSDRMIDPLANANPNKPRRDGRAVRPSGGDAGNQGCSRDAGQPVPPVQVFSDARNASHRAIKSLLRAQV